MRIRPSIRPTIGLALSIGFVLAVAPAVAAAPSHDWTRQFGSTQDDYATGVAVDRAGNSIVVGFTYGALKKGAKKGETEAKEPSTVGEYVKYCISPNIKDRKEDPSRKKKTDAAKKEDKKLIILFQA